MSAGVDDDDEEGMARGGAAVVQWPSSGHDKNAFLDEGAAATATGQEAAALRGWYSERARKTCGAAAWW